MKPVGVGLIGCGKISGIYSENLRRFSHLEPVGCAALRPESAEAHRDTYGYPAAYTVDELLARPEVEIVLNLTNPAAHAEVTLKALTAGKWVYSEKPLGTTREQTAKILQAATGLGVGCAPDTFLGAGYQTARKLLDEGGIGRPTSFTAHMLSSGPEGWHPNPAYLYREGAGPLWDMGPYYLTALIHLLGPVKRVAAMASKAFDRREITTGTLVGKSFPVEVPTHHVGLLEFYSGAIGALTMSFDVSGGTSHPCMEIHGTKGTLILPDPNFFDGPVMLRGPQQNTFSEIPLVPGFTGNLRGLGLADMAAALRLGRKHRSGLELALHVVDILEALVESAHTRNFIETAGSCERPEPLTRDDMPYFRA